jgi:tripartite-type tricarboxylate transporter receptor subunit TctC
MKKTRNALMITVALLATACLLAPAAMAEYPERPITLAVGFAAGGSTDQVGRALAAAAEKILGQNIVVINKPGGGGTIAASWLKSQKPNGYKLVVMTPAVVAGGITKKVPYDVFTDFTPILRFTGFTHCIGSLATKPWSTLEEMLDAAKKGDQPLLQGSPGVGTMPHLAAAELGYKAGVKFKHVPFKGGKPQLASMLCGHIDFYNGPPVFWPHVKTGKVNFLAVYADKRLADYPDVPTVREVGYDVIAPSPIGIAGPKGLKPEMVKVLHDAFKKAAQDPAVVKVCRKLQMPLKYENAEQYKQTMKEMWDYYAAIADRLGLRRK